VGACGEIRNDRASMSTGGVWGVVPRTLSATGDVVGTFAHHVMCLASDSDPTTWHLICRRSHHMWPATALLSTAMADRLAGRRHRATPDRARWMVDGSFSFLSEWAGTVTVRYGRFAGLNPASSSELRPSSKGRHEFHMTPFGPDLLCSWGRLWSPKFVPR